jgi:hypothetical protein
MADGAGMEERVAALVLVNDELKYRLDAQADSAKGIETKAVILVGFAATAVQFVISHNHKPVWAALASAAYATAFGAGLWAIRLRLSVPTGSSAPLRLSVTSASLADQVCGNGRSEMAPA